MQPSSERRNTCVLFTLYHIAFDVLCGGLPGEVYFIAAAATAGICAVIISKGTDEKQLINLCKCSVVFNLAGWMVYEAGFTSTPYVLCFTAYYIAAILIISFGGIRDGLHQDGGDFPRVLLYPHQDSGGYT